MLFEPTYKYDIIKENEYGAKMDEIKDVFSKYLHTGYFTSIDNASMYYEYIKVSKPKANIVVIHGYTEFTKKNFLSSKFLP